MSLQLIAPDGTELDLKSNTRINLSLYNSIFESEILKGSFSYSFMLPLSDKNQRFFKFPQNVSAKHNFQSEYPDFVLKSGLVSFMCLLKVRSITEDGINVNVFTGSGQFAAVLKNTPMKAIPMDEVLLPIRFGAFIHAYMGLYNPGPSEGDLIRTQIVYQTIPGYQPFQITIDVKFRTNGVTTIGDIVESINNPKFPDEFVFGNAYTQYDVVYDQNGNFWEAAEANEGFPLVDYFSGGKWFFIGSKSIWQEYRRNTYSQPWRYADPMNDKRLFAEATEGQIPFFNSFKIYDTRSFTPDLFLLANCFGNIGPTYLFDIYDSNVNPNNFYTQYNNMLNSYMKGKNALSMTDASADHVFPCIINPEFNSNDDFQGQINYYDNDNFVFNSDVLGSRYKYAISPQLTLKYVLKKLFEFLGYEWNNDFFNDLSRASKIVFSNRINNQVGTYTGNFYLDVFASKYYLGDCLPEATIAQFINAVRNFFFWGLFVDLNRKKITIKTFDDVLDGEILDWSDIATPVKNIDYNFNDGFYAYYKNSSKDNYRKDRIQPSLKVIGRFTFGIPVSSISELPFDEDELGIVRYVKSNDSFYQFRLDQGDVVPGWKFLSENFTGEIFGNGEYRHDVGADSLHMSTRVKKTGVTWKVPYCEMECFSRYNSLSSRSEIRFLNYLGLQPDSSNAMYPMASNDNRRLNNSLTSVQTHTRLENSEGLVNTSGKRFVDFIQNTHDIQYDVILDQVSFSKFDFSKRVKIGNQLFLVKSLSLTLPLDFGLAKAVLCPIR